MKTLEASPLPQAVTPRDRSRPVLVWAAIGAAFLGIECAVLTAWAASGDARRVPAGPTEVPGAMQVSLVILTGISIVGFAGCTWFFVLRPWRRDRRLTTDSYLAIAFMLIFWQDPLVNMVGPYFSYNSSMVNLGSWLGVIPGWPLVRGEYLAEPPFLSWPMYLSGVFLMIVVGGWVIDKIARRNPTMSRARLAGRCFAFFLVFNLVFEALCTRLGFFTYLSTVRSLTLFPDHYYRLPMYQIVIWAAMWTAMTCLRSFKDDDGRTFVERGIDRVNVSGWRTGAVKFLALSGAMNAAFFFIYVLPVQYFTLNADAPPKDVLERSYFVQMCGGTTGYACPDGSVPIPRQDSVHLNPGGELVVPDGVQLPAPVPVKD